MALRARQRGAREGTQPGDVIQYVICTRKAPADSAADGVAAAPAPAQDNKSLAERAFHPQEVLHDTSLVVDTHYYLSHQLQPVVARLCAPLEATSDARIAECLGLDPSKFKSTSRVGADHMTAVRTLCAAVLRSQAVGVVPELGKTDRTTIDSSASVCQHPTPRLTKSASLVTTFAQHACVKGARPQ